MKDYWHLKDKELFNSLGTTEGGLTELEAKHRLKQYGLNRLKPRSYALQIATRQAKSPFIWILIATGIIALAFGELVNSIVLLGIVIMIFSVSFIQEYRSEKIAEDLNRKVPYKAIAIRGNERLEVDADELVPGDIVILALGSMVPADLRLVESSNLEINEAALTGESVPARKTSSALNLKEPQLNKLVNYAFSGTSVSNGQAKGVVLATGENTQLGRISKESSLERPETEFQKGLKEFSSFLVRIVLLLTIAIFALNAYFRHEVINSLLFALAVAIGIAPGMMPVILTVGMANGARIMAKKDVIVKRLIAIEDFGNMDVLCTDKTGTLTEGNIRLHSYSDFNGNTNEDILLYGLLCNSSIAHGRKTYGNPIDVAIWHHSSGNLKEKAASLERTHEIPFDYYRKMMSTVVATRSKDVLITKGSPSSVLKACSRILINGRVTSISHYLKKAEKKALDMADGGLRVIAVAYKEGKRQKSYSKADEKDLTLMGFIAFTDPAKKNVKESLEKLKNLSIDLKILTGDNEIVTRRIANEVGVRITKIVLGAELDRMDEAQLKKTVEEANIFCRLNPDHKSRIIKALKSNGHDVGYMGDGINDAPALHESDVGISVNTAVDVAKDASDIILLKKNLDILADGVLEGRKIFGNTMKDIMMGTSSDFGNMFSMSIASLFLPFLPMLPSQVLLNDLLYDASEVPISTDNVDKDYLKKPKRFSISLIRKFMLFFGLISSAYDIITFWALIAMFHMQAALFQTGWFIESVATQTLVVFVIRTRTVPFYKSKPSKWVSFAAIAVTLVAMIVPFSPIASLFGFSRLPLAYFALLAGIVITYLLVAELGKMWFFRKYEI